MLTIIILALIAIVVLFAVKVEDFRRLMRQNFELCNRVMLYLGSRLSLAEQKMESLIFKDARTRIVDFIKDSVSDRGQRVGCWPPWG